VPENEQAALETPPDDDANTKPEPTFENQPAVEPSPEMPASESKEATRDVAKK
jgi:hypothetical protein